MAVSNVGALHEAPVQRIYGLCSNSGQIRNITCGFAHYLQRFIFFSAGRFRDLSEAK